MHPIITCYNMYVAVFVYTFLFTYWMHVYRIDPIDHHPSEAPGHISWRGRGWSLPLRPRTWTTNPTISPQTLSDSSRNSGRGIFRGQRSSDRKRKRPASEKSWIAQILMDIAISIGPEPERSSAWSAYGPFVNCQPPSNCWDLTCRARDMSSSSVVVAWQGGGQRRVGTRGTKKMQKKTCYGYCMRLQ